MVARPVDDRGRKTGGEVTYRAPVVVAAEGNSTRLSLSMGLRRRDDGLDGDDMSSDSGAEIHEHNPSLLAVTKRFGIKVW